MSRARMKWYSSSEAEFMEYRRKRANSLLLACRLPSTMLVGIDAEARVIWFLSVARYGSRISVASLCVCTASECDFSHTFNFLKSVMLESRQRPATWRHRRAAHVTLYARMKTPNSQLLTTNCRL